jgi:hypothetical protein
VLQSQSSIPKSRRITASEYYDGKKHQQRKREKRDQPKPGCVHRTPSSCAQRLVVTLFVRAQLTRVSHKQAAIVLIGQSCIGFLIMPFSNTDLTAWHQLQEEPACYLAQASRTSELTPSLSM